MKKVGKDMLVAEVKEQSQIPMVEMKTLRMTLYGPYNLKHH